LFGCGRNRRRERLGDLCRRGQAAGGQFEFGRGSRNRLHDFSNGLIEAIGDLTHRGLAIFFDFQFEICLLGFHRPDPREIVRRRVISLPPVA